MLNQRNGKLLTLLSLYMAQSIPMSFFSTVVPVIMRQQHYSLEAIGLMQLIKLPWVIKFLWAPYVDRTGSSTGGYRRWILFSEVFYAFSVAAVAFFSLEHQFSVIIVLMVLAITASATQDIATDAWAILTLKKDERSLGNSMQSMGSFLGSMIGSGALLVVYHYLGWTWLLLALAVVVLFAIVPVMIFRPEAVIRKRPRSKSVSFKDIGSFFAQAGIWPQIFLLAVFHSSLVGIMTMVKPLMIDFGYTIKEIGIISGIFGTATGALFAMLAGLLMRRISREHSATVFALLNLLPPLFFVLFGTAAATPWVIWAGVALLWGAYAAGMVFVFTIAMDRVRHCREGTDFTLQIVIVHFSSLMLAVLSGKIAGALSYSTLFIFSFVMGLITLLVVKLRFRNQVQKLEVDSEDKI
jgi:MFS family permease